MARRAVPITGLRWPGTLASALLIALVLGTLGAVALRAEGGRGLSPADWAAIRFTLVQALVSASVSVALAIPVARALARREFFGRSLLVTLLGAPFILPVIVAILGLLAVFGRNGILSHALGWFGLPPLHIYGFHGVVLAHVFFNLPLAIRMLLQGWLTIPSERFRLAASLNAPIGPLLERPMLRATAPGVFLVVFLICLTSFAVALALGGGPKATTVELAIYQALRFDFDLGRAALLAMIQVALCTFTAILAHHVSAPSGLSGGLDRAVSRWDGSRLIDTGWIAVAACFLLAPLTMVVLNGLAGLSQVPSGMGAALTRSLGVAMASTALATLMALALALRGGRLAGLAGVLPLASSSLVVGTGLFLIIRTFANPLSLALPVTALVNAMLAVPFAVRVLTPAVRDIEAAYGHLADGLGLTGWTRFRLLILPRLRRPLGFSAGLAAALSMGDLGVIALFAGSSGETLPLFMYRLMGSYQMQAAAGAGLVLLTSSLALFWLFDRGGRIDVDT